MSVPQQLAPPRGSRMDRTPPEVRAGDGYWSTLFDSPGKVPVLDRLALSPEIFAKVDGIWTATVKCRSCRCDVRVALEGELEFEVIDGRRHEVGAFDVSMLSPASVMVLQVLLCEACIDKINEEEAKEEKRTSAVARSKDSGIPVGLVKRATWDSLIDKGSTDEETRKRSEAIDACRQWSKLRRPERGVLLHGPAGSGKTRLAATAALARLTHSPITWVSCAKLMADLQAGWDDDDRKRALKVLTGKGALVLDDLDKINERSSLVMSQVFAAIDTRAAAEATMIVTTNLKPSELKDRLGEAITSRLLGICNARPYPGVDLRLELGS